MIETKKKDMNERGKKEERGRQGKKPEYEGKGLFNYNKSILIYCGTMAK